MALNAEILFFFLFSVMAISGAVFMIQSTEVIHMALSLAFTFFSIAGIYFLLNAEFLAAVQVLIYTGAVSILMLFGIMLTKHGYENPSLARRGHMVLSFLGVAMFFTMILWVIYQVPEDVFTEVSKDLSVVKLGESVFKQYMIPFELTSILLLVALVGAVILARKEEE